MVRRVLHDSGTPRELYMYDLTRDGGAELVNAEWKPKKIIIEGIIKGTDIEDLEANIDTFKKYLSGQGKNLDIEYASGTRRYEATASVVTIERDYYHISYAPFSIEFTTPLGFGKDISTTSYSTYSIALHTLTTDSFSILGTVVPKYQIQLLFKLATAVSTVSVTINGDKITIDEAITAGQTLVIDTDNKKVTLAGVEKRYTGIFPRLILGTNNYKIVTSSTSHLYDVTVNYIKTYL